MSKSNPMIKKIFTLSLFSLLYAHESSFSLVDLQDRFGRIMATDAEQEVIYATMAYKIFIPSRIGSLNTLLFQLKKLPQDDQTLPFETKLNSAIEGFEKKKMK
jgi:hypothetical protein